LLRILCGLSLAETGQINWNGNNIQSVSSEYRANLSYLGHKPALKPDLTAYENLVSAAATGNRALRDADSTATEYLRLLGVVHTRDRLCRQLSAGQKQRIAVARVVMSDAPMWILDEPGTSLDTEGMELLSSLMRRHIERNGLIIFTSHHGFDLPIDRLDRICLDSA
jgi:heme exporter protein A